MYGMLRERLIAAVCNHQWYLSHKDIGIVRKCNRCGKTEIVSPRD